MLALLSHWRTLVKDLNDVAAKRALLYSLKPDASAQNAAAQQYLAAGRAAEALELFERTRDREGLLAVRRWAVARGDGFVLTQTERFLEDEASKDDWKSAAERAFADGRWHNARDAYLRAGDEASATKAGDQIPEAPAPGRGRHDLSEESNP